MTKQIDPKSFQTYSTEDREVAYEIWVELKTKMFTQAMRDQDGLDTACLESIYSIFPIAREVLKRYGKNSYLIAKYMVFPLLNAYIRPFTSKWHMIFNDGKEKDFGQIMQNHEAFRNELRELQGKCQIVSNVLKVIFNDPDSNTGTGIH